MSSSNDRPLPLPYCSLDRNPTVISAAICKMAMRAQLEEVLYDALITTLTEHGVIIVIVMILLGKKGITRF